MNHTLINLNKIQQEIHLKIGKINSIIKIPKIIAVSKTFSIDKILPIINSGHIDFGENKVQEAVNKWEVLKNDQNQINLHMIGKLQKNKAKHAVRLFDYIHSLDNIKLAEAPSFGKSALSYEPNAKGTLAYLAMAGELISRIEKQHMETAVHE